jgi:D-inositol-3-phosphate glycosyltransferase
VTLQDGSPALPSSELPRHVAIISVDLAQVGGHLSHVRSIIDCLEALGVAYHVISLPTSSFDRNSVCLRRPRSWRSPRTTIEGMGRFEYAHVGCWFADLPWLRRLPSRAVRNAIGRADLVHIALGSALTATAIRTTWRPNVLHVATMIGEERKRALSVQRGLGHRWLALMTSIDRPIERRALARADVVLTTTRALRDEVSMLRSGPTHWAPHAVGSTSDDVPGDREKGPVLAVGRWDDPRKGLGHLLRSYAAAAHLAAEQEVMLPRLLLVGPTDLGTADRALTVRLGIDGAVDVETGLDDAALVARYRTAACLVVPSFQEGFSIPVIEAMACGCPVIATRCGGPEELIENGRTGWLVDVADVDALAAAMIECARDRARAHETAARATVESLPRFRPDAVAQQLASAYAEALTLRA